MHDSESSRPQFTVNVMHGKRNSKLKRISKTVQPDDDASSEDKQTLARRDPNSRLNLERREDDVESDSTHAYGV